MLDADQFSQLMTVRERLEPMAAAAAAAYATPEGLAAVEQWLVEMKRSVKEKRTEQYLEAHYQFHFRIYAMCRMPIVEEIIENAWLRCAPTLRLGLPKYIPGLKRYEHHVGTLDALRRGDGQAAGEAIRSDIVSARTDISALLEDQVQRHAASR
jgi:DNA-binding GntR family transcriptional regulator